jgi:hypothetical protein
LKSQKDENQQKKGFFQFHKQEKTELLINIPKDLGALQKNVIYYLMKKAFLKN